MHILLLHHPEPILSLMILLGKSIVNSKTKRSYWENNLLKTKTAMLQQLPLLLRFTQKKIQIPLQTAGSLHDPGLSPPLWLPSTLTPAPTSSSGTQQAGLYSLLNLLTELLALLSAGFVLTFQSQLTCHLPAPQVLNCLLSAFRAHWTNFKCLSLLFFNMCILLYLLLAVLVFVASHRLSLVAVRGLLTVVAFPVEHRL